MRSPNLGRLAAATMVALAAPIMAAAAADNQTPDQQAHASGKVIIQSGTSSGVPVAASVPPLNLSDQQRARIRAVLSEKHTDVSLNMKENEAAKSYEAKVDEGLPKGLDGEAFPQPLISEIPETKRFTYLKFKDQILIVNPLDRKIVLILPATAD